MMGLILTGGIFLLDHKVKELVNNKCIQGSAKEILGGRLILRNCHNEGTMFGVLRAGKENCQEITALALGGVLSEYFRQFFHDGSRLSRTGLSLILGGALSNYVDRRNRGFVTDYVSFGVKNKKIRNMIFNISDFCIFGGSFLWLMAELFPEKKKIKKK